VCRWRIRPLATIVVRGSLSLIPSDTGAIPQKIHSRSHVQTLGLRKTRMNRMNPKKHRVSWFRRPCIAGSSLNHQGGWFLGTERQKRAGCERLQRARRDWRCEGCSLSFCWRRHFQTVSFLVWFLPEAYRLVKSRLIRVPAFSWPRFSQTVSFPVLFFVARVDWQAAVRFPI